MFLPSVQDHLSLLASSTKGCFAAGCQKASREGIRWTGSLVVLGFIDSDEHFPMVKDLAVLGKIALSRVYVTVIFPGTRFQNRQYLLR
jgi:hypothetical protein